MRAPAALGLLLKHQWPLMLVVWALVLGATLGISLLLPPQYVATASVLLDVKPDPIAGVNPALAANSLVTTQVDVIASDRVARRVIRNLRLLDNAALKAQWAKETEQSMPLEQWLAEAFRKRLDIRPSRDSNVIMISYRAGDARSAANMANGFVQAYLDTALELRVDPARQFATFFDEQSREARKTLTLAQERLSAFQRHQGLVATDERLDIESARLAELSSQVAAAMGQRSDAASRAQAARQRPLQELPDVMTHSVVAGLQAEHSRLAARLEELDARLGPQHPQRLEMAAGLHELSQRLEAAARQVGAGLESHDAIARGRVVALQGQLDLQRKRVMDLRAARNEAAVLSREVDNAQRAFDAVVGRQQLTQLESQTTQAQAHWLSQATAPSEPDSPRIVLNMILAAFFGAVLAVGAGWWWWRRSWV